MRRTNVLTPGMDDLEIVRRGLDLPLGSDLYHFLRTASWPRLVGTVAATYLGANVLFAAAYLAGGECIAGAEPGSFRDAFAFSVQTMSTIGYGAFAPATTYAHTLVLVEAFLGMLFVAMVTGLVFTKFSTPTARVLFSAKAVIGSFEGRPTLMVRVANARTSQIIEAHMRVSLLKSEVLASGEELRRIHDVELRRSSSPLFALSWTAFHVIDEQSPLHGLTREDLECSNALLSVTLSGIDDVLAETIHAHHLYRAEDVVWNARHRDVMGHDDRGRITIDYTRIHDVVALDS